MATNSAHNGHGLFWRWFHRDRHQESGWQRERQTGDVPAIQMDATPAVHYPLHQDEVHVFDPSRLLDHPHWLNWLVAQPETRPRYADEKTGPKSRQQLDGHLQQINPQYAPYQPPQCTPREGMQRIAAPQTPVPDAVQSDTLAPLPGLPRWLVGATPAGDLPVARQHPADVQMTLPYSNHHVQDVKPLTVLELPEWMGAVKVSRPLPMELGFSDPDLVPDLPTEPHKPEDFAEHSWLYGNLKLDPMVSGEIAAVDKTASYIAPSAIDQLTTLASQPADDDTVEVPTVMRKQHMKGLE